MGWAATLGALRRRWYVVVVGLLVTAGLGFGALTLAPPTYEVTGTVLLMPSTQQREQEGNPFLGLGNLSTTGLILTARLNSDQQVEQILGEAQAAGYLVGPDPILGEPALMVTAWDKTPQGALDVLDQVIQEIPVALDQLQQEVEVPQEAVIGSIPLTRALEPEKVTKATQRALVAALVGGLAMTVGGAVGIDALLRRRRRDRLDASADTVGAVFPGPGITDGPAAVGLHLHTLTDTTASRPPAVEPVQEPPTFTGVVTLGASRRQAGDAGASFRANPPAIPPAKLPVSSVQWPGNR